MNTKARAALLLACVGAGAAVGAAGLWLGGSGAWFLAVPAAVALGWLFVADPTRCAPGPAAVRNGLPSLPPKPDAQPVTLERVSERRDGHG